MNITNKRRARVRQLKDEFISLAAHEIRTPITVIKAQAQLAERFHAQGKFSGDVVAKTLNVFVQESDRLAKLSNDLLEIARIDTGCFEIYRTVFDLVTVVEQLVAKCNIKNLSHEIKFEKKLMGFDQDFVLVSADRERALNALTSVIGNAIRYSPAGGRIIVELGIEDRSAIISIQDFGIGIAKDKIANIFDRYYQAHQRGLKGPCGLGLGLYLCRESLMRMGGEIKVQSDGPGKGATFILSLPLAVADFDENRSRRLEHST